MPELPKVSEEFDANTRPFVDAIMAAVGAVDDLIGKVGELQAEISALHGKTVDIGVDAAGIQDVANAMNDLSGATAADDQALREWAANLSDASRLQMETTQILRETGGVYDDTIVSVETLDAAYRQALIANAEFNRVQIETAGDLEAAWAAATRMNTVLDAGAGRAAEAAAALNATGAAATAAAGGWRIFGLAAGTVIHWVIAASAEFLAVAIPAAIALGAGLAVAAQGAQNAYTHFSALYAATESTYSAFHQTVGSVLGLHSALQQAQNAANPGVYEILGSAINDAKTGFGQLANTGLQVVHMFDEFSARVTVDLQGALGGQIKGLLSGMVTDLQQFGNVLGNLGHAVLNFASAMPGLAHVLLAVAVGLSDVIEWASRGAVFLTMAMGLEEMYRWGGLALSLLVRMTGQMAMMSSIAGDGGFIVRFGAAALTLTSVFARVLTSVGSFVAGLEILPGLTSRVGSGLITMGAAADEAAAAMSPLMAAGIVGAAAALGFLIYKLDTAQSATEKWISSSNQAVASASDLNVLPTIYNQIAGSVTRAAAAQTDLSRIMSHDPFSIWTGMFSTAAKELAAHVDGLIATANTVRGNINTLAGAFHTSAAGALALANAAGVNLTMGLTKGSVALKIAEQQITNLKTGLGAMAAPIGVIGADMEAMGIQSQLASSKVGQVNQALDAFIAGTTGGMNSVMQFNAALRGMGKDTASTSMSVDGAIRSISASAAHMGFTLQGIGPHAQQSWQQFDAAVQQGNSVLDTFRTGMAEGMVSAGQYNREIQAVGGSLLPFAAHNRTALSIVSQLAQEMGLPASHNLKTLASDFGITGRAAQNMATMGMERAIARMSNLSAVARNLSATISGQLDSAMAGAIVKASGLDQAYLTWATHVKENKAPSVLAGDLRTINQDANFVNTTMHKAVPVMNSNATAAKGYGSALKGAGVAANDFGGAVKQTHDSLAAQEISAKTASLTTQGFGQQAHTAGASAGVLATQAGTANAAMKTLGTSAATTRGNLGTVNNEIRTTGTAASGSAGPLGTMIGNIHGVGDAAGVAAGQVSALASAISSLQSKTITLTTNMVTTHTGRQSGGPVAAGIPYMTGEAGRELFVPAVPGFILNHPDTERFLSSPGGGSAAGGSGGVATMLQAEIHNHSHVYLDGEQIFQSVKSHTAVYGVRNGTPQQGRLAPG